VVQVADQSGLGGEEALLPVTSRVAFIV